MGQTCATSGTSPENKIRGLETVEPLPPEPSHVDLCLSFRTVAKLYAGAFFATMAAGALATFTSTNYSPQTDKITLFFGMFNPCIFFDHYPAKLVATIGLGIFLLLGFVYSAMLFLYQYRDHNVFQSIYVGIVWSWVTILDLLFLNVMTTNLYPLESPDRRLHGVHWHRINGNMTVTLLESPSALNETDIQTVKLHTTFYIIWIFGQVLFTVMLAGVAFGTTREQARTAVWEVGQRVIVAVSWLGMLFHAGAMLVIVLHDEAKVVWYFKKDLDNSLQHWIVFIDAWTGTSVWGWIPIMFFRFILPPGTGVRLRFYLEKYKAKDGDALPERWVGRAMSVIACICVLGAILHTSWESDTRNLFRIASVMRTKPFAYFGAPMYLLAVVLLGVGLGLTLVQWNLREGKWRASLMANASVCFVSFYSSTVIILERTNFSDYIMLIAIASYLVLILQINYLDAQGSVLAASMYSVAVIAICGLAIYTQHWAFYFLFTVMLTLYNYVVPDGPLLYIALQKLEEPGLKSGATYNPIPQQQSVAPSVF